MITRDCFNGPLAAAMSEFIAYKRMQGYTYRTQFDDLKRFNRFITEKDCSGGTLQNDVFARYQASIAELTPATQEGYLSVVRGFSRYLNALVPESAVMPTGMAPRHPRPIRFRRISSAQVRELMEAAPDLRMHHPVGPQTVCFLIGLLYTTGLRISEALKLDLGDVDLSRGTLYIRRGKFAKDRLVVMSESTKEALGAWLKLRSHYASSTLSAPLLPGGRAGRLTRAQSYSAFTTLCRRCGLHDEPPPRLHDLRHNFACRCIARWREAGKNVQALLPVLSNAMGHVSISSTQFYVHLDAGELQKASNRFQNDFFSKRTRAQ